MTTGTSRSESTPKLPASASDSSETQMQRACATLSRVLQEVHPRDEKYISDQKLGLLRLGRVTNFDFYKNLKRLFVSYGFVV